MHTITMCITVFSISRTKITRGFDRFSILNECVNLPWLFRGRVISFEFKGLNPIQSRHLSHFLVIFHINKSIFVFCEPKDTMRTGKKITAANIAVTSLSNLCHSYVDHEREQLVFAFGHITTSFVLSQRNANAEQILAFNFCLFSIPKPIAVAWHCFSSCNIFIHVRILWVPFQHYFGGS